MVYSIHCFDMHDCDREDIWPIIICAKRRQNVSKSSMAEVEMPNVSRLHETSAIGTRTEVLSSDCLWREDRGDEGGSIWGGGVPLPSRLGGLREHRELLQWGLILRAVPPEKVVWLWPLLLNRCQRWCLCHISSTVL